MNLIGIIYYIYVYVGLVPHMVHVFGVGLRGTFFFFSGRGARVVLVSVWGARVGLGSAPVLVRGSGGSGSQSSQGGSRLSLRRPQSVLVSVWVLIVLVSVWGGPLVSLGLVRVGVLIKDTLRTSQNRRWFFARAPELNQTT